MKRSLLKKLGTMAHCSDGRKRRGKCICASRGAKRRARQRLEAMERRDVKSEEA